MSRRAGGTSVRAGALPLEIRPVWRSTTLQHDRKVLCLVLDRQLDAARCPVRVSRLDAKSATWQGEPENAVLVRTDSNLRRGSRSPPDGDEGARYRRRIFPHYSTLAQVCL